MDQNPTLPDKAGPGDTGPVSSPGGMSPILPQASTPLMTIFKNLLKRLQNVKSPQKRQGPTPERGHSKKRHRIDFSTSDKEGEEYDADSRAGSTIILHQRSGSSSDDGLSPLESKDSPKTQARHYITLQAMYKKSKFNQDAVSQLLDLEFEARRDFIYRNVLKEEDRPMKILDAYPCFKELHHVMDELRRILDKGNKKFTDEVKKRWEEFCAMVQFYGVWKKVMKPPMNMNGMEKAIELVRALPTLFPSPAAPPQKIGHASEALLHVLQPTEDPTIYLQKRPLSSPLLLVDGFSSLVAIGTTPITTFAKEELGESLLYLIWLTTTPSTLHIRGVWTPSSLSSRQKYDTTHFMRETALPHTNEPCQSGNILLGRRAVH
ncbi:uncharacterized protein LOC117805233 [Notolabrus celidotus]|uniref:uncharacterized protein LOC117805233 n=1 Tax=Notolabrus celidotus TaxID=1203425 RepID=UPI00148F5BFC|nr:uncharacterized protein LOC117805233 [Notolabrus celidotus]